MSAFLRRYLLWPGLVWLSVMAVVITAHMDAAWADTLYRWQGGQWLLRDGFITRTLIHEGGRMLVWLVALMLIITVVRWWRTRPVVARHLLLVVVGALAAIVFINVLKGWTALDCPWDLQRYGGAKAWLGWGDETPAQWQPGRCFPAGHASGAYAWLGFYFAALSLGAHARIRHLALGLPLATGVIFGLAQQLRGAHFLSHDLVSLALCWVFNTGLWAVVGFRFPRWLMGVAGAPLQAHANRPDPQGQAGSSCPPSTLVTTRHQT